MGIFPKVPVIRYHSIADNHEHIWSGLSLPVGIFERQLLYLHRKGYNTITLYDLYAYVKHGSSVPPKPIVLTFDDGYLDNWVHAFPILRKYGMKATIFVATDFIDPSKECRLNLEDVWSERVPKESLQWWGYLSYPELRKMYESGLIDIQSHTQTHTWYFTSNRIIDFHHPGDEYVWLFWNTYPKRKYRWLTEEFHKLVPWGTPVYDLEKALLKKRYYEDPLLAKLAVDHVARNGNRKFFERPTWKDELFKVVDEYRSTHTSSVGYYETEEDYLERVKSELCQSKKTIEVHLNKTVDFCCWPFGDYNETIHRISIDECGYLATVTKQKTLLNKFGDDPTKIGRTDFGQDYQGPWKGNLIFLKFYGTVNYQRGLTMAYSLVLLSNRLMRFCNLFR